MSRDFVRVSADQLPIGARLSHPINDNEKHLLLAASAPISSATKRLLRERGIHEILLHPDDAIAILGDLPDSEQSSQQAVPRSIFLAPPTPHLNNVDAQLGSLSASSSLQINNIGPPLRGRAVAHGNSYYDEIQRTRLVQHFSATKNLIEHLVQQVLTGEARNVQPLSSNVSSYATELTSDTDSTIASSKEQATDPDFAERGIRLAVLGMALAMEMGWDEPNVREVGFCGLIHDWGMFRLPEKLHNPRNPVVAADWYEIANHPLHTVDMLSPLTNISNEVRLATSQVHENPDGSGYPYGLTKEKIHPFASVLHVADAYITLTAEMRGRPPYYAYDTMVYLLRQVKLNRIDETVMRSLLNAISLFPIGSYVQLSDGCKAQVIRRSSTHYTAPIVRLLGAERQVRFDGSHSQIVDLAQSHLRVATPLSTPGRQEIRIHDSQMDKILWDGADG